MEIKVFNREKKSIYIEKQFKDKQLNFLYNNFLGRILLKLFISNKIFSKLSAISNKSKKSINKINPFIKEYEIDISEFEKVNYNSFDDFFTRKIIKDKRPITMSKNALISVADSKLSTYKIDNNLELNIKGTTYSIKSLLKDEYLSNEYKNGTCLVFRLTVDDYHRYCFLDNGSIISKRKINGCLHTVGPMSAKYKVYSENNREYALLKTKNFDEVIQIEIGALLVGRIINHNLNTFKKGEEKGYFAFGGSTIVLLFKENIITIDNDIIEKSKEGIETKVKLGEKIGEKL